MSEEEIAFLGRVAKTLEDYLDHLVVIGGCASVLYRHHPMMRQGAYGPLGTRDLDLAVAGDLEILGGTSIPARLKAAGFVEGPPRSDPPPSEFVPPKEWGPGLTVEILTPLHGGEVDRAGRTRQIVKMRRQGLTAIRLRWIDILMEEPWLVTGSQVPGIPAGLVVQVAHPAAYLAQKLLSSKEQGRAPKAKKDLANCYIVVAMARDRDALAAEIGRRMAGTGERRKWLKTLVERARRLFSSPASTGCLDVEKVLGRDLRRRVAQVLGPFVEVLDKARKRAP